MGNRDSQIRAPFLLLSFSFFFFFLSEKRINPKQQQETKEISQKNQEERKQGPEGVEEVHVYEAMRSSVSLVMVSFILAICAAGMGDFSRGGV